jgi:hypothetical protein
MRKHYLVLTLLFTCATVAAEEPQSLTSTDTISAQILYQQGKGIYDATYRNNAANMRRFIARIDSIHADSLVDIHDVTVSAGASPEGSTAINDKLSKQRAESLCDEIARQLPYLSDVLIANAIGVDWNGLAKQIKLDPNVPAADEALDIITNTPIWVFNGQGKIVDSRKNQLMRLNNGKTWSYLYSNVFPRLRGSAIDIVCHITHKQPVPLPEPEPQPEPEPEPVVVVDTIPQPVIVPLKPFYMAVKTNMLYDALIVPSIGAEFYLGKNWSIVGNWHYGWWKCDHRHNYWRTYGGDIAVRRWFGSAANRKPLTGHHLGVYAQMITYDFELGGRGYLAPRWSYAAGVEYGYSLPISRRLNIDFTLGLGYMGGTYKEYIPIDQCYVWQATKNRHWVGPTKIEISLVWLIGRGNVNVKK